MRSGPGPALAGSRISACGPCEHPPASQNAQTPIATLKDLERILCRVARLRMVAEVRFPSLMQNLTARMRSSYDYMNYFHRYSKISNAPPLGHFSASGNNTLGLFIFDFRTIGRLTIIIQLACRK